MTANTKTVQLLREDTTREFPIGVVRACAILRRQHLHFMEAVRDLVSVFEHACEGSPEHSLLGELRHQLEGLNADGKPLRKLQPAGLVIAWLIMIASGESVDPNRVDEKTLDEHATKVLSGHLRVEDHTLAPAMCAA